MTKDMAMSDSQGRTMYTVHAARVGSVPMEGFTDDGSQHQAPPPWACRIILGVHGFPAAPPRAHYSAGDVPLGMCYAVSAQRGKYVARFAPWTGLPDIQMTTEGGVLLRAERTVKGWAASLPTQLEPGDALALLLSQAHD